MVLIDKKAASAVNLRIRTYRQLGNPETVGE
jgi:hypothetical protein